MAMRAAIPAFKADFFAHHSTDNVEVEFRIGKFINKYFDTNVGEESFFKMKQFLEKYKAWESVTNREYEVFSSKSGRRTIIDASDDSQHSEIKRSLSKIDYRTSELPFDVRMAISTEIPCEGGSNDVFDYVKRKLRTSFVRKGLSIDMTVVTGSPDDPDDEEDTSYQVEFEIIKPGSVGDINALYNHMHKIIDLLKGLDC